MPDFRRLGLVGVAGIAGVLALAACGGSSAHASSAPTPTTAASNSTAKGGSGRGRLTSFVNCMSSHGVTLPERPRTGHGGTGTPPSTSAGGRRGDNGNGFGFANRFQNPPPGVDPTKYQAALNACRSMLPTGGDRLNNSAFQAYRSCLSDHGVQLPAHGQTGSAFNRNDPKVQTAMKTCAPLLPQGFGRGTTTTTLPKA